MFSALGRLTAMTSRIFLTLSIVIIAFLAISTGLLPSLAAADKKVDVSKIHGRIQLVTSFPDYKVKVVTSFPDLRVQTVENFPDRPGRWQIVDSFPDFKIQLVDSFPDFTVQFASGFPGPARSRQGMLPKWGAQTFPSTLPAPVQNRGLKNAVLED